MDLEFALDEPLETLCFHYLLNQVSKSRLVILNSILLHSPSLQDLFRICQNIAAEASTSPQSVSSKECLKNLAELFIQIIKKCPISLKQATPATIHSIIRYSCPKVFCAMSGNQFISLIWKLIDAEGRRQEMVVEIENMLSEKKMQIGSYRQSVRQELYKMWRWVLEGKDDGDLKEGYLVKIVRGIEDEKDPRNMPIVLQIYLYILQHSTLSQISGLKHKIFECLEMYYPIDFEGDTSKHNIDLATISSLLDQCLAHPLFNSQLQALLQLKMSAPPISKYIPTFILLPPSNSPHFLHFCINLLFKTSDQEILLEDYQAAPLQLSDLIAQIFKNVLGTSGMIKLEHYSGIIKWMKTIFVERIFDREDNDKYAGRVISIVQGLCKKGSLVVRELVASFVVRAFIDHCKKGAGDVIYKLGMLVPILEAMTVECQLAAVIYKLSKLLIMSVSQIFHQAQQPQPKLLVLKVLMLLGRDNLQLVHQSNVLPSCLSYISSSRPQSMLTKAYTDYLVELHSQDPRVRDSIPKIAQTNARLYGLITLCLKTKNPDHLPSAEDPEQIKQMISIVKTLNLEGIISFMRMIQSRMVSVQSLLNIVEEIEGCVIDRLDKSHTNVHIVDEEIVEKQGGIGSLMLLRRVWRCMLDNEKARTAISTQIIKNINDNKESDRHKLGHICAAHFNKALMAHNIKQYVIECDYNNILYKQESSKLLPVAGNNQFPVSFKNLHPTIIHYLWSNTKEGQKRGLLIERLPTCILAQEADAILPTILNNRDIEALSKIYQALPEHIVASEIIPFITSCIQTVNQSTDVDQAVAAHSIVDKSLKRAEEESDVHDQLLRMKGRLLIALEERALQHKKRRVRQSARKVFSDLNMLK